MSGPEAAEDENRETFDRIAFDLRELREESGPVSYAELVRRITELRLRRGMRPAAAAPARSTVYNAFQPGRARMDTALLRDIVLALGAAEEEADAWAQRCRLATRSAMAARREHRDAPAEHRTAAALPRPEPTKLGAGITGILLAGAVIVNLLGLYLTGVFTLSVYLDMVGTAIAALVLGPWHGVAVAIASNGLGFLTGDLHTLEFIPVNVIGALVWGYGVRRFRLGRDLSRYVALNLLTALACSLVAAPIVVATFHGGEGHAAEQTALSLTALQIPFVASVFSANIITSILDKLLTGFIALIVFSLLHRKLKVSAAHMPLVERIAALSTGSAPDGYGTGSGRLGRTG